MIKNKLMIILLVTFLAGSSSVCLFAGINEKAKTDQIQRTPDRSKDVQENTVSSIQFYTTNYGIFGYDVKNSRGGGYWPRGSVNQYVFAGGVWFAAMKPHYEDGSMRKYVSITYNPNNGNSWMVPGRIEDGPLEYTDKYKEHRVYFSTDFNAGEGTPFDANDGPNWPVWDASQNETDTLKANRYFGYYVYDNTLRKRSTYPKGPAFISQEDIFCVFKDTDLSNYDGGAGRRSQEGYPLKLQFEHTIYSWGFGDYKDFIFLRYDIQNKSSDTLFNCWLAPVLDIDIGLKQNSQQAASNDRVDFYRPDESLNLAYQWSNPDMREGGRGFGYLGFDFLESPAVKKIEGTIDTTINGVSGNYCWQCSNWETIQGSEVCTEKIYFMSSEADFVRKDKRAYSNREQLGLVTFRNWPIELDPKEDDERYNFISAKVKDGDNGPGDKRFMMATGPFNVMPGDTVRTVYAIILANPAVQNDPDGSIPDLAELVRKDKFAQLVYDNNFKAPSPPDICHITRWESLNNGVLIQWDTLSEMSTDKYEEGMDFLGFRIYRSRNRFLDTFDVNLTEKNLLYSSGKGPFGWKQVAQYEIPTPFYPSVNRSGLDPSNTNMPFIDSLLIVGPAYDTLGRIDPFAIQVMRVGRGINLFPNNYFYNTTDVNNPRADMALLPGTEHSGDPIIKQMYLYPIINNIDTSFYSQPWGPYYGSMVKKSDYDLDTIYIRRTLNGVTTTYIIPQAIMYTRSVFDGKIKHNFLLDSVLLGVVYLNPAYFAKDTVSMNPLFRKNVKVYFEKIDTINTLPDIGIDPVTNMNFVFLKNTVQWENVNGKRMVSILKSVSINESEYMRDADHLKNVLDSVYLYIQKGLVRALRFPAFEQKFETKINVINPYMAKITNNRTFIDVGDDDGDGVITTDKDLTKTEKLINSVDYHYRVLAYDQGDYMQMTPRKLNKDIIKMNLATTYPNASHAGNKSELTIIREDKEKLGGLYNFRFFAVDQDRVNQKFAGHEIELEFNPYWNQVTTSFLKLKHVSGLYYSRLSLKDLKTNELLYDAIFGFEPQLCSGSLRQHVTEDAAIYVLADSVVFDPITGKNITFGLPNNMEEIVRSGKFTTGDFTVQNYCYGRPFSDLNKGIIGFSFDYTIRQLGGMFRPLEMVKLTGESTTPIVFISDITNESGFTLEREAINNKVLTTQWVADDTIMRFFGNNPLGSFATQPIEAGFNNGPGEYLLTFKEGGTDKISLQWKKGTEKETFNVPYLTYDIQYVKKFNRSNGGKDSVECTYPSKIEFMELPKRFSASSPSIQNADYKIERYIPDPRNLGRNAKDFIHKYNSFSYGWINHREVTKKLEWTGLFAWDINDTNWVDATKATNIGSQGKYYLTGYTSDNKNYIDFINFLNISGCYFVFDYVNKGSRHFNLGSEWDVKNPDVYGGPDFKVGDQVRLSTTGGALGLPLPGAKVICKVSENIVPVDNITDDILDQVKIVPNPYYLSHIGQRSPYDAKIYFTKLPTRCTIEIYTATGDLVQTIEHDESTMDTDDPTKEGIDMWNLLSSNRLRVSSQAMFALIKTPNGAQSIKNFALVVGGSRLITEEE